MSLRFGNLRFYGSRAAGITVAVALLLGGCGSIQRNGIPNAQMASQAKIPNMDAVRFWGDEVSLDPIGDMQRRIKHIPRVATHATRVGGRPVVETLALSGGGSDGAFGAGLLAGWTERGDRPEFELVTGVSAGAIIAPFAYLGPRYDQALKSIWTEYQQSQVLTAQFLPGILGGDALTDTTPLRHLIAKYIDAQMLREIAQQYERGRILMVLTTNLDAQRPVTWNMGEIARTGTPEALELFRKVIMASAAIPGAFPPVNIDVTVNGQHYEELHVDGGTTRELFVLPIDAPFNAFNALYPKPPIRKLYIVKNGKVVPEYQVVPQTTLQIASRSISTLIKSQNWSEVYRIYRQSRDAGADFNFMSVPASFTRTSNMIYDPAYQKALYAVGLEAGRAGHWQKAPHGQAPITPAKYKPPPAAPSPPPSPSKKAPPAVNMSRQMAGDDQAWVAVTVIPSK